MCRIEKSNNIDDIKKIILDEDILPTLVSKYIQGDEEGWDLRDIIFYLLYDKSEPVGIIFLPKIGTALNMDIYLVEIGIKKGYRGKKSAEFIKNVNKLFFSEYPNSIIFGRIKKTNKSAYFNALKSGFKKVYSDKDEYIMRLSYG